MVVLAGRTTVVPPHLTVAVSRVGPRPGTRRAVTVTTYRQAAVARVLARATRRDPLVSTTDTGPRHSGEDGVKPPTTRPEIR